MTRKRPRHCSNQRYPSRIYGAKSLRTLLYISTFLYLCAYIPTVHLRSGRNKEIFRYPYLYAHTYITHVFLVLSSTSMFHVWTRVSDPDQRESEKLDTDLNKSQNSGAFKAHNGAVEGLECEKWRRGGFKWRPVVEDLHHLDEQDPGFALKWKAQCGSA